jgi:hypothetical protein
MSDLFPVAGAKISIGGVLPAEIGDMVASDFASQTWVEIDGWEQAGEYGDAANIISTPLINRGRVVKQKGTRDAGDMENRFAIITGDAGMTAVVAAERTRNAYAFRVVYDDKPNATGTGTTHFFVAKVVSARFVNGEADSIRMRAVTLGIDSNIVEVAPVAGV